MSLSPTSSGKGAAASATTQVFDSLLAGSAASFDVTNIPAGYTHLMCVGYLRGDTAAAVTGCLARFNNDSAASYDEQRITGSAATPASNEGLGGSSITIGIIPAATATAGYFGAVFSVIPAYTNATGNKPIVSPFHEFDSNLTAHGTAGVAGGKWRTVATPITRVTVLPGAGSFVTGSRFSVYGLL